MNSVKLWLSPAQYNEQRINNTSDVLEYLLRAITSTLNIAASNFLSASRKRILSDARAIYCGLANQYTDKTTIAIGKFINRDHSCVIHNRKKDTTLKNVDRSYLATRQLVEQVFLKLKEDNTICKSDALGDIVKAVERQLTIQLSDLKGSSRARCFVDARATYCGIARLLTPFSLDVIGEHINRDHSTVINSIKQHNHLLKYNKGYADDFNAIINQLKYRLVTTDNIINRIVNKSNATTTVKAA